MTDVDIDTFTQEFRLVGATDTMDWMVGAYFFDESIDQRTGIVYGPGFRPYADILSQGVPGNSLLNVFEAFGSGPLFAPGQGLI